MKPLRLRNLFLRFSGLKALIVCLLILNVCSIVSIYSSLHRAGALLEQEILHKQIIWIIVSWAFLAVFSFINYRWYWDFSYLLYGFNLLLLAAVYFFGKTVMGAQRWI